MDSRDRPAPPSSPYRLETFRTLVLRAPDGRTLVADHGQQGRRLALLAALAASGESGLSRDRLLLLFWPDSPQSRARHALEQMLYKARKSLDESLFAGVNPLRLDPAVVSSDVGDFERALRAGDLETAAGLYRGPFLDGFYLPDAPEFSEWVEGERRRLEAEYAGALERLARAADASGDREAAVRWWSRLGEVDPLGSRSALGLVRALAASGDYGGALLQGERYARRVEAELGTGPGPELSALLEEVRGRAAESPASPSERRSSPFPARPEDDADVPTRRPSSRRRASLVVLTLAAIGIVYGATRLGRSPAVPASPPALPAGIAVLPLDNLGDTPEDGALAAGMTQELIAALGRTEGLRVIASTSAFAFEGSRMDVRQIADSLGVSHVLEGGVQRSGSRLRLQIRLVDSRDGSTRWSETYDREIGDVFAIQDEIARSVVRELDLRLAGGTRPAAASGRSGRTTNLAAYEWFLRGTDLATMRSDTGRQRGIAALERAIALDPGYAAAYAAITHLYLGAGSSTRLGDQRTWEARAEGAARRAVELDDSLAEAHAALGWANLGPGGDLVAAERELELALALDPNVHRGHEGLARVYLWTGPPDAQLAEARLGVRSDPLSHSALRELGLALNIARRPDEALELLLPLKSLHPPAGVAGIIRGQSYAQKGMWPEAAAEFRWSLENSTSAAALAFLGYAEARIGRRDEAERILADLLANQENSKGAFGIAVVYAGLRDYDRAFGWLDRALDEGSVAVYVMDPMFAELHGDPRFTSFLARVGVQSR